MCDPVPTKRQADKGLRHAYKFVIETLLQKMEKPKSNAVTEKVLHLILNFVSKSATSLRSVYITNTLTKATNYMLKIRFESSWKVEGTALKGLLWKESFTKNFEAA